MHEMNTLQLQLLRRVIEAHPCSGDLCRPLIIDMAPSSSNRASARSSPAWYYFWENATTAPAVNPEIWD